MSKKNAEYDFKWCPGCGDFGVRRALEQAIEQHRIEKELPVENNVVVAGIGCSGNLLHLLEGPQPYGFHGIHGRTLPVSMGIKSSRPDLNVIIVAGDGDFLGIGAEHIAPQAARNLDVVAVIMDNAVYGLTKGQSSPTSALGMITSSTPYGKNEEPLNPLSLYLSMGVPFVSSIISSKVKEMSKMITEAMNYPGFAIVHVQSPCTTYNDTYEQLKGNLKKEIDPLAWDIPDDHDSADINEAHKVVNSGGVPLGIIYRNSQRQTFHDSISSIHEKSLPKGIETLLKRYTI